MTVISAQSVPLALCTNNKSIPHVQVISIRLYPLAAEDRPLNCWTELSFVFDKGDSHLKLPGNSKFGYNMREITKILD
jgi:hypothetical protein